MTTMKRVLIVALLDMVGSRNSQALRRPGRPAGLATPSRTSPAVADAMIGFVALVLALGIAACEEPRPSASVVALPSASATPTPTSTAGALATPVGTISIRCFLVIHALIDDFRHIESQLDAFPAADQLDLLASYGASIREHVTHAPPGCFSDDELAAHRELFLYLSTVTRDAVTAERIQELMSATGLPHPTPIP
jgi:hypothetical protein